MIQELQIGKDGAEMVVVWERWIRGAIQRLADDSNDQVAIINRALRFWTAANGLFMPTIPEIGALPETAMARG
jgi:hypothetical protein